MPTSPWSICQLSSSGAKELQQQAQQLQAAVNTLNQVEQQVRDIEDIPQGLMSQVTGLISQATQNPLTGITTNLSGLFNGSGTGSCANSANLLRLNQFADGDWRGLYRFVDQWRGLDHVRPASVQSDGAAIHADEPQ